MAPAAAWPVWLALGALFVAPVVPAADGILSRFASLVVLVAAGAVVAEPDVPTGADPSVALADGALALGSD